ncbi:hypothetical protein [Lysobacter humi (ex Lee et al. 2017)]
MSSPASLPPPRPGVERVLVGAGFFACAAGYVGHAMWEDLSRLRIVEALVLVALAALAAVVPVRVRRWSWASALLAVWMIGAVAMAGVATTGAALLLALGAMAIGSLAGFPRSPGLSGLLGAAVIAGATGWLLPLPVHHAWTYLPVLVTLVAWRRRHVALQLRVARGAWRRAVVAAPGTAAVVMAVVGLASTGSWLPTVQFDDLAYHLNLPWQLATSGRYMLDPTHQAWSLAPWAGDVLQAIAQTIAGGEARGPVNLLWLASASAALWSLGGALGLVPWMRWLSLALHASTPFVLAQLGGMQTELPATAPTVALMALVLHGRPDRRHLLAAGLLGGLLCGLKSLHGLAAVGIVAAGLWRWRAQLRTMPAAVVMALAAALGVGGSSYAYAAWISGNPVLPLFNHVFRSPAFPAVEFTDTRWLTGFGPRLPWDLTFTTSRFFEGWDGALGFTLVALGGAMLAALRERRTRLAVVCGAVALLLPLVFIQYARYAVVGLVLLVPPALLVLQRSLSTRHAMRALGLLCALNLAYLGNAYWTLRTGGVKRALAAAGRDAPLFDEYAPERRVAAVIRERGGAGAVLDLTGSGHAEFGAAGRTATWYSPRLSAAAAACDRDPSGTCWAALLRREKIAHAFGRTSQLHPSRRAALARLGADPTVITSDLEWWRIPASSLR